jgi:hypothetical protein
MAQISPAKPSASSKKKKRRSPVRRLVLEAWDRLYNLTKIDVLYFRKEGIKDVYSTK